MPSVESASSTKPVCVYEDKAIDETTARTRDDVENAELLVVMCARYTGKSRALEVWTAVGFSFKLIKNTVYNRSMSRYIIYILIFGRQRRGIGTGREGLFNVTLCKCHSSNVGTGKWQSKIK